MKKLANIILQDILLDLTYAKLKHHAPIECYFDELKRNMIYLLKNKLPYQVIENSLSEYGYEIPDIRKVFKEITGVNPQKMLFARYRDLKNTPDFIPTYNYGWGINKDYYYFIICENGIYQLFKTNKNDPYNTLQLIKEDLSLTNIRKELFKYVKRPKFYDLPAWEEALLYKGELKYKSDNFDEIYLDLIEKEMPYKEATKYLENLVKKGKIFYDDACEILSKIAEKEKEEKEEKKEDMEKEIIEEENKKELKEKQEQDINKELAKSSPTDYFKANLPNRLDISIPNQIKSVLSYINNKASDIVKFNVGVYKINYELHEIPATILTYTKETGIKEGDYKAIINVILEFEPKQAMGKSKKFGLMIFFVAPDGSISTSDSFKGEDDIIYGFSEEGISQYLEKNL